MKRITKTDVYSSTGKYVKSICYILPSDLQCKVRLILSEITRQTRGYICNPLSDLIGGSYEKSRYN